MEPGLAQQRASVEKQMAAHRTVVESLPTLDAMPVCDTLPKTELARMIEAAAARNRIDPALVFEVARQESAFQPCAVSSKGAQGLMQLMPETQAHFQVGDPFNPEESLAAGSKLLKELLERYHGDVTLALSAYNAGTGRVDKAGGIPDISETKNYVVAILSRLML